MAEEEGDSDLMGEVGEELARIDSLLDEMEFQKMLSGEFDAGNAIVSINSGAGGTESQDWAGMLLRMYLRWCEKKGYRTEIIDYQEGEEAGIKSVTFTADGDYAYGYLRAEIGIHRLVRISPFDANKRRHTSFASVDVAPEVNENIKTASYAISLINRMIQGSEKDEKVWDLFYGFLSFLRKNKNQLFYADYGNIALEKVFGARLEDLKPKAIHINMFGQVVIWLDEPRFINWWGAFLYPMPIHIAKL